MIETHDGRQQICCDHCPTSYPNDYAAGDFQVMISDAKTAGWKIERAPVNAGRDRDNADLFGSAPRIAGSKPTAAWIHTCPSCRQAPRPDQLL